MQSDFPELTNSNLSWLYDQLHQAYDELNWWPATSRFEVVVGAVLVQNTAWGNVERAIAHLKLHDWLTAETLLAAPQAELAQALRPAGYFNVKTRRLLNLCHWWQQQGGFDALDAQTTQQLRRGLLSVNGLGPETADDILLYAFKRAVFVIDAYTRRLLSRLGWQSEKPRYEVLRAVFERTLRADAAYYGQYHALIVEHAKLHCRARPLCKGCPLLSRCQFGQTQ